MIAVLPPQAGELHEIHVVTNTAGVVNHVSQGDGLPVIGKLWEVGTDIVIESELTLLLEQKNAERDELFGDRSYIENRTRGQRNIAFQIRHAVGLLVEKVTILDDGNDGAGSFASVPSRKESVHSLSARILGGRVGRCAQRKQHSRDE